MRQWSRVAAVVIGVTTLAGCGETTDPDQTNPDQVSQQIGAVGGVITSKDSNLTLTIPPGALSNEVTITITPVASEDLGPEWDGLDVAAAYDLGPDGTTFAVPVGVTLRSDQVPLRTDSSVTVRGELLLTSSAGAIEALDSAQLNLTGDSLLVRGRLGHFSTLARARDRGLEFTLQGVIPTVMYVGIGSFTVVAVVGLTGDDEPIALPSAPVGADGSSNPLVDGPLQKSPSGSVVGPLTGAPAQFQASHQYTCTAVGRGGVFWHLKATFRLEDGTEELREAFFSERATRCEAPATFSLQLSGEGASSASALIDPPGQLCSLSDPAGCAAAYPAVPPVIVTITPTLGQGTVVGAWGGDCAAAGSGAIATVPVAGDLTCQLRVDLVPPPQFDLTVDLTGGGTGTVTSNPPGIALPGDGTAQYPEGQAVALTAAPDDDSDFIEWSGDCSGAALTVDVTMDGDKSCVARFEKLPILSVTTSGTGTGVVTSNPAGIIAPPPDAQAYLFGQAVTLTALASPSSDFAGWSGDCSGTAPVVVVTMGAVGDPDPNRSCDAEFNLRMFTLAVTVSGSGAVSSDPAGISTPANGNASYVEGTVVTLTAAPGANYDFGGWSGDCSGSAQVTQVTMTANKACQASFVPEPPPGPFELLDQLGLGWLSDYLGGSGSAYGGSRFAARGSAGIAATQDLSSVFVADAGTSGDVLELNLSNAADIQQVGSGGLCEGLTAVVHADHPSFAEGLVYGFSATTQWSCNTGYPLGQAIQLFNMGSPTGKAILMPGDATTILVAHWGASSLVRMPQTTFSEFIQLTPGVRSCPRFLRATTAEVYVVTVEGTAGTTTENCNTNRGLHRVRLSDNTVTGFVGFGTMPRDPVINTDGSTIYVPDYAENRIHVVDAATLTVTRTIDVPGGPVAAVLTADGMHLIVARWDLDDIAMVNIATGAVVGNIASGGRHPTALLLGENNVVVVLNYGDADTNTDGAITTFRYTIP